MLNSPKANYKVNNRKQGNISFLWSLTQNFVLFKQFEQVVKKNEHED